MSRVGVMSVAVIGDNNHRSNHMQSKAKANKIAVHIISRDTVKPKKGELNS